MLRSLFTQARVVLSARLLLEGLLGTERRKTGWMRAEAAGDPGLWRQQAIVGRGSGDAGALRDVVRATSSCGVARQYTGSAGKITNCQIGVSGAYVSRRGHAVIERAL